MLWTLFCKKSWCWASYQHIYKSVLTILRAILENSFSIGKRDRFINTLQSTHLCGHILLSNKENANQFRNYLALKLLFSWTRRSNVVWNRLNIQNGGFKAMFCAARYGEQWILLSRSRQSAVQCGFLAAREQWKHESILLSRLRKSSTAKGMVWAPSLRRHSLP